MRTQIKICGIQSVEDAIASVEAGADALGLVFYPPSKRYISPDTGGKIVAAVGPFVTTVALFVNPTDEFVRQVLSQVPVQVLQFHGDESPEFCRQFGRPYIKAFAPKDDAALKLMQAKYGDAVGWLLDAPAEGMPGGNGLVFDWSCLARDSYQKVILAGGLRADNVVQAVTELAPQAVDVSSGVEGKDGRKDVTRLQAFCRAVKEVDRKAGSLE